MALPSSADFTALKGLGLQALGTLGLRAFQLGALLLTTLVLARVLGPAEFGAYSYGSSWLSLLAGLATVGFTHASVREVAQALAHERYTEASSHIRTAYVATAVTSVLVAAAVLAAPGFFFPAGAGMSRAAAIGVALVPFLALLLVGQGVLRGQGLAIRAQAPELLYLPALMLFGTLSLVACPARWRTAEHALQLYGACLLAALLAAVVSQWRALPAALRRSPGRLDKKWVVAALPFMLVLTSIAINAQFDVLVVGQRLGARETGVYALAARLSMLPAVALTAVATPLSPAIAMLFAKQQRVGLQRLVDVAAIAGALGTSLIAVCAMLGAPWLMHIVDPSFEAGHQALFILCLGRIGEAWLGPGGTVLAMTRHAWPAGMAVAIGALASIGLNLLLIGPYGIEGAAVATAASCVLRGVAMWYGARSYEGVKASAFEALFTFARREPAPRADHPPAS